MKSLYESLLDDFDTIAGQVNPKEAIEDFIKNNYRLNSDVKYTISDQPNEDGKYIVDMKGRLDTVKFIGKGSSLTKNLFVFGELSIC